MRARLPPVKPYVHAPSGGRDPLRCAGAYALLSSDTRATATPAQFAQGIEAQPSHVRGHTIDGVNPSAVHPRAYVVVFVRVTFTNGDVSPHDLLLVPQGGHWRVRGVPFWGVSQP